MDRRIDDVPHTRVTLSHPIGISQASNVKGSPEMQGSVLP